MKSYQLLPDVHIERFDDQAVLFIAKADRLITVNAASADLYTKILTKFGRKPFDIDEVVAFVCFSFQISVVDALAQVRRLLSFGLRQGLVCKASETRCSNG